MFINKNKTNLFFLLFILSIPLQLGKHFWPKFSFILGLRIDYLSPTFYISDIFIILFILFYWKKTEYKYLKYLCFISICLLFEVLLSKEILEGFYSLLKFMEFSLLGFSLYSFFKNENYKRILFWGLGFGVLLESAIGFLQFIKQGSIGGAFYFLGERTFTSTTPGIANATINGALELRPYATFSHPNVFAFFLFIAMSVTILLFKNLNKKEKILATIVLFFGTFILFLTLSRLGIILFLLFLGLKLYFSLKTLRKKIILLIVFILICLIVFIKTPLFYRFSYFQTQDISQRVSLLVIALRVFLRNPIWGVGIGEFLYQIPFFSTVKSGEFLIQPVHNIYFLILAQTGLVGLILALFLLFKIGLNLFKKKAFCYLILFLEILFWGNFDHFFLTIQQGQILVLFFMTLILSTKEVG